MHQCTPHAYKSIQPASQSMSKAEVQRNTLKIDCITSGLIIKKDLTVFLLACETLAWHECVCACKCIFYTAVQ